MIITPGRESVEIHTSRCQARKRPAAVCKVARNAAPRAVSPPKGIRGIPLIPAGIAIPLRNPGIRWAMSRIGAP
jgi:hypothetical protein